jgi:uncharacterized protein HemX
MAKAPRSRRHWHFGLQWAIAKQARCQELPTASKSGEKVRMSASDLLGIFLLLVVVGFVLAFYLIFLQRRLVTSHAKAVTQVGNGQRLAELQEQSEKRQLRPLQIAEEQLMLQRAHNELLRELLTCLVERAEVSSSTSVESSS